MAEKRTRGERAGLSRSQVLDAALALTDREGLRALSMRRLGAELGVEAMTLYHYVPNKDALLDGLVERALTPAAAPSPGPWHDGLRAYAHSLRAALLRHPGILPLVLSRPAATPATLDAVEHHLGILTAAGFPLGRALDALNTLTLLVIGHTTAEVGIEPGHSPAPFDPDRHPLLAEAVRTGAGTDDTTRFHFAVDALIAGFAADSPAVENS
ncbi:TetR/AcrR family transcriptional regulator C-terminal domain-containing protein [Kitasatospora sp. McL0602]|uniref:TetR/AcrR family transcriptional regulator C-terminal domain-containing protein n=1 Tax=Kitasatospora sp. McL0602 TaxID=3439530 RepID=UPI003F8927F2